MESSFVIPSLEQIVLANRQQIEDVGGLFLGEDNLLNPGPLTTALELIEYPIFGVERYPTLEEKIAAIGWSIITGHVFHDGNKRTGLQVMELTAYLNGRILRLDPPYEEEIDFILSVAAGTVEWDAFLEWVRSRLCNTPVGEQ